MFRVIHASNDLLTPVDLRLYYRYFSERCLAEYSESISAKRRRVETLEMFLEKIENRTINQREIEMLEQMIDFKSNNNSVSHQFTAFWLVDQS